MTTEKHSMSHWIIKFGFYGFLVAVVAGVLYGFSMLFVPIVASVLLTFLLQPVVNYFETKGGNRLLIITGIYLAVLLAVAFCAAVVIPLLVREARNFSTNLPAYREMLALQLEKLRLLLLERFPDANIPDLYVFLKEKLTRYARVDISSVLSYASGAVSLLSVAVIVPIITFFLLADGHLVQKSILRIVPNRYFEMFVLLFHKIVTALQKFIRGQLIDALAVGILTSVGLAIIGLPYFLVIGIIAGVGNLIPYLGPVIGFLPALFVMLVTPGWLTVGHIALVIGVFAMVQFLEGTFVYPIAVGKSVDLHPLIVIIGITVGGQLGGVLGMLLAIPLISVCKVAIEVLYSNLKSYSII